VILTQAVILFFAGTAAGIINTVVGSGSLVTFPILVALGCPPVQANVTNNIGIVAGSISGAISYRKELAGHVQELVRLADFSAARGVVGIYLLLRLPTAAFQNIVLLLIVAACALVMAGPAIRRWSVTRKTMGSDRIRGRSCRGGSF
jgi:uncharacterized membrane protein YfcA